MQFIFQAGRDLDILEDPERGLRIMVSRMGAELISIARRHSNGSWMGFLWRDGMVAAPAAGWGSHATVMGYYLHRLWNQESQYGHEVVRGGNHGFLRNFLFEPPRVDLESGSLTYEVPGERVPRDQYPRRVAMQLEYRLKQGMLQVTFRFKNEESHRKAHVSFGLHPGFAVSNAMRLLLPPGWYRRYMAPNNFLNGEVREFEFEGGVMPWPKQELPGSFLIGLEGVVDRRIVLEDREEGRRVDFDFSEVPFFTLWSDFSGFIAIEPCWGLPDSEPPVPFDQKLGIQTLEVGGELIRSFSLCPKMMEET